jgi:hypothetical protein
VTRSPNIEPIEWRVLVKTTRVYRDGLIYLREETSLRPGCVFEYGPMYDEAVANALACEIEASTCADERHRREHAQPGKV